jgi:hypothetical protein
LRWLRAVFWSAPLAIGRVAQRLGARIDDVAAWVLGLAFLIVVLLLLLSWVRGGELWAVLKKGLVHLG